MGKLIKLRNTRFCCDFGYLFCPNSIDRPNIEISTWKRQLQSKGNEVRETSVLGREVSSSEIEDDIRMAQAFRY
jgi:hypothetical protein